MSTVRYSLATDEDEVRAVCCLSVPRSRTVSRILNLRAKAGAPVIPVLVLVLGAVLGASIVDRRSSSIVVGLGPLAVVSSCSFSWSDVE
jgi:hypothetical protein